MGYIYYLLMKYGFLLAVGVSTSDTAKKLDGLHTVQYLRSKLKGHVGGSEAKESEAKEVAQEAVTEHETFANHFEQVYALVVDDLATIEQLFGSAR